MLCHFLNRGITPDKILNLPFADKLFYKASYEVYMEDEYEKYKLHHKARLSAKPGITGMWQVSGRSDITDFENVVKLDTEYIKNWSIGKDLRILAKTVRVVLTGKGSM